MIDKLYVEQKRRLTEGLAKNIGEGSVGNLCLKRDLFEQIRTELIHTDLQFEQIKRHLFAQILTDLHHTDP